MNANIIEKARKFVEEECKNPKNWWGYEFYSLHLVSVHKYANLLAKKLNADSEVVELAAWFHDVGSVIKGRKDHHITGAEIAEEKLSEWKYPKNKIQEVKHCILTHRGSQNIKPETVEAQILRDADSLATFDHISGPFLAAFVYEKMNQIDGRKSVMEKYYNSWNKLSFQESKKLIQPKYEAITLLLK